MIVKTRQGELEGMREDGVTVFKGVRYAAPVDGDNRWRAPQDPPTWNGVRKADEYGPACIQPTFASMEGSEPIETMSEDCLYLNVWTPETAVNRTANRPVMVWIHGGAFKLGEGRSLMYNGGPLAQKGAVVVTFNYRLGFLGFFVHPTLEREVSNGPINFGLLDQIKALDWVKDNIAEFGGNPNNVTIFGESAGAASVLTLMASPKAEGKFHKAIAQSGYAIPERNRDSARKLCVKVAQHAWLLPSNPTLKELRGVSSEVFTLKEYPNPDGSKEVQPLVESLAPTAVYGDEVLPDKVRKIFEDGTQHNVPLLIGSNSNEQSVALAFGMDPVVVYNAIEAIPGGDGKPDGKAILAGLKLLYREDDLEDGALNDKSRFGGLIMRDLLFTMHVRSLATWHAKKDQDVFRYYFKYVPDAFRPDQPHGVDHGGEIVFPFNTGDIAHNTRGKFTDKDRAMAGAVSSYWFTFARDGKPTAAAPGIAWNAHTKEKPSTPSQQLDRILMIDDRIELWVGRFMITRLDKYLESYPDFEKTIEELL